MKNTLIFFATFFFFQAAYCQPEKRGPFLDEKILERKVDALVEEYRDLDIFSGVVLIAEKGDPVYHKAFGLAERTKKIPNTLDTKFDIGSMNKTFTEVVVLQLVREGKLHLQDTLGKFLKGFPAQAAQEVTVEQLLQHRSGYGDYHTPDLFEAPKSEKTIAALVERIKKLPLQFPPGTDQAYSNAGYVLLGAIIERVTGKNYYQNVRERTVEPLGLSQTYLENKSAVPDRATGYFKTIKGVLRDNEKFLEVPSPAGGFQSTTTDMLTFYREYFYGDRLLDAAARKLEPMFSFIEKNKDSGAAIPIAGGFEGANTVFIEVPRDQVSIVVFANMDEPVAEQLGLGILAIIRGKAPQPPALPAVQQVYAALNDKGVDYVKDHFDRLTVNFHPDDPRDLILNRVGYELLFDGDTDEAIAAFQLNAELFPGVANVWDSLGEAWLKKGDKEKALKYYKKALDIRPDLPSAKKAVKALEHGDGRP